MSAAPAVLTNVELLRRVRDDLKALLSDAPTRGYLSVAGTLRRALEMLATPPQGLFVVLLWDGERNVGTSPLSGVVEHTWSVFVSQTAELNITPDKEVLDVTGPGNKPSLLDRVNVVRDRIRSLLFPEDISSSYVSYVGGSQVFDSQEAPLNSFRLQFALQSALPEVAYRDAYAE